MTTESASFRVNTLSAQALAATKVVPNRMLDRLGVFEVIREAFVGPTSTDKEGRPLVVPSAEVPRDLFDLRDGRIPYETAYREVTRNMMSIVGLVNAPSFLELLTFLTEDAMKSVTRTQPNLDWRIIGVEVDEKDMRQVSLVKGAGITMGAPSTSNLPTTWEGDHGPGPTGFGLPQQEQKEWTEAVVRLVFAVLEPFPELDDPWARTGEANPNLRSPALIYNEKRTLAAMQPAARDDRRRCEAIMTRLWEQESKPLPSRGLEPAEVWAMLQVMAPARVALALGMSLTELNRYLDLHPASAPEPVEPAPAKSKK